MKNAESNPTAQPAEPPTALEQAADSLAAVPGHFDELRGHTATGANVVGAACPFCNTMLRDALSGMGDAAPKLLDIAQIAAASITRATERPPAPHQSSDR